MSHLPLNDRGLTLREVEESRAAHGSNLLTPPPAVPWWRTLLQKFDDPLIIILCIAGALSVGISFYEYYSLGLGAEVFFEPAGIFAAILLATGLAFIFEYKADREFALLNKVSDDEPVQVRREGNVTEIPRRDVVVGDIVILNTGEEIPADGDLLRATSMSVDESTLTGEPMCHKSTDPAAFDPDATFATDRVMRGTKIMEGHGVMRVTAVGDSTENGKVFIASRIDDGVKTPLSEQLDRLGRFITVASYIVAALVVAGRIIMYFVNTGGFDWMHFIAYMLQTVMIAVTLIVVAVPEGLPMAVNLSLAYSMRRMLRTNNLVRKLHACETMGAATVICTDKTGTLTQNRMQVNEINFYGVDPASPLACGSLAVNSTAQLDRSKGETPAVIGNPTEGALLLWLEANGVDYSALREKCRVLAELPFTTERKFMATAVELPDGSRELLVKGAPEIVIGLCDRVDDGRPADDIRRTLSDYQNRAMRTLAFAHAPLPADGSTGITDGALTPGLRLNLLATVAISDPVRADVPPAIRECLDAGIAIKIVTGDTPATAREIGRQIGLWNDAVDSDNAIITGTEFAALTDSELDSRVGSLKIIARARPLDKRRLVEALQRRGEVVAVTGDGTNDAPALKAAQVGLSMGDGTSVAKEASDITIIDNSFSSIGRAVMWGRSLYRNIRRFILFQLTVNVAACLIVLAGAFMGTESPLTVTQMLWVNLIMDTFAAMALASLPPSESVMKQKPRRREDFIISPAMMRNIVGVGGVFFAVLCGLLYLLKHTHIAAATDLLDLTISPVHGLTPYELSLFFTFFVMLQFWNMFNARAWGSSRSAFNLRDCRGFLLIVAMILFGQILIVSVGGNLFNVVPISATDWLVIIASTSLVLWIGELSRSITRATR